MGKGIPLSIFNKLTSVRRNHNDQKTLEKFLFTNSFERTLTLTVSNIIVNDVINTLPTRIIKRMDWL